ncbi:MAG: hypothetical protein JWP09_808 [Candidatus Taylorbacteria bacterium]|nr:hypothetical protein [Candidatus Taylorbacteria bacterium]
MRWREKRGRSRSGAEMASVFKRIELIRFSDIVSKYRGRLAQLVEQFIYTEKVTGSSPVSPTKIQKTLRISKCFLYFCGR